MQFLARAVDRAVQRETGGIGLVPGGFNQVARQVDLQQVGRRDLVVVEPEGIDQVLMPRSRQARRDVIENRLGPAEIVDQAIAMGQLYAQCPLFIAAMCRLHAAIGACGVVHVHMIFPGN